MPKIFILAVEDSKEMQVALTAWLNQISHSVVQVCDSIEGAKTELASKFYDIVFLDLNIKDSQGIETFYKIKAICPKPTAIILLTGLDISESTWRDIGADGYIQKTSLVKDEVIKTVQAFLRLKSISSIVRRAEYVAAKLAARI